MVTSSMVSTMGTTVSYITLAELKRSPVYNQLTRQVPKSSPADNDAELERVIFRVSSMINDECNQNLAATVDVEVGEVVVAPNGDVRIHCRSNPIIAVLSVSLGYDVYSLQPVNDLTHVKVDPWRFTIPRGAGYWRPGARMSAEWSYINGYPVTTSTAPVSAGATSLQALDTTGIVPGQTILTIEDGIYLETVIPTAVNGNVLTVPGLQCAHQGGVGVHALPGSLKEVTLLLISRLHDTWSLTMGSITTDGSGAKNNSAQPVIMCEAGRILNPYKRTW